MVVLQKIKTPRLQIRMARVARGAVFKIRPPQAKNVNPLRRDRTCRGTIRPTLALAMLQARTFSRSDPSLRDSP